MSIQSSVSNRRLRGLARRARGPLISDAAWSRIEGVYPGLPTVMTAGFECRLDDDSQVDVAIDLKRAEAAPEAMPAGAGWDALRSIGAEWADPNSCLHAAVGDLWLEFDLDGGGRMAPGVFLTLVRDWRGPLAPLVESAARAFGCPPPPNTGPNLDSLVAALPPGGRVVRLGVMFGRGGTATRVELRLPPPTARGTLERLGWRDAGDDFDPTLAALEPQVDALNLDLDLGERVEPRLGIECLLRRPPRLEPRWAALVGGLVDAGLCRRDKAEHLLAWPGGHRVRASSGSTDELEEICVRQISHLKLTYAGRLIAAKAYLMFRHVACEPGFVRPGRMDGSTTRPA